MNRHACGVEHPDSLQEAACEYESALRASLHEYAATLDSPPTKAQVDDLWAHARLSLDDGRQAARWARQVLNLGWRPSVGPRAA